MHVLNFSGAKDPSKGKHMLQCFSELDSHLDPVLYFSRLPNFLLCQRIKSQWKEFTEDAVLSVAKYVL